MRTCVVFCLIAIALAQQANTKSMSAVKKANSDYDLYIKNAYCSKHLEDCKKCYKTGFQTSNCARVLQVYVQVAKNVGKEFNKTPYCKNNATLCNKCLNKFFGKPECKKALKQFTDIKPETLVAKEKKEEKKEEKKVDTKEGKMDAKQTAFMKTEFCKNNAATCTKCIKNNFKGKECLNAKNRYQIDTFKSPAEEQKMKNEFIQNSDFCKKHLSDCKICGRNDFNGDKCKAIKSEYNSFKNLKHATDKKANEKEFMSGDYCKKNLALCKKCMNKFYKPECKKVQTEYTNFKNLKSATDKNKNKEKFLASEFCKGRKAHCNKCLSGNFGTEDCKYAKKIYDDGASEVEKKDNAPALTEGLAQKAMAFFKTPTAKKGKAIKPLGGTGISLYDGLPWDPKDAYELDVGKVKQYENKILGQDVHYSTATDNYCSGTALETDGIKCADCAALPILAFRDIDEAGMPIGWTQDARPKKVAAILKDGEGKRVYLPLRCVGDAKGHAWPGGLAQTFLSTAGQKKGAWKFNSDGGHIKGPIIGNTITDLKDIRAGYGSVTYSGAKVSVQMNLETHSNIKSNLKGYTLESFVSWKQ